MRQTPGTFYYDVEVLVKLLETDGHLVWSQRVERAMLGGATSNEIVAALRSVLAELRKADLVLSERTSVQLGSVLSQLAKMR